MHAQHYNISLKGKVAVITGASSGIGQAVAELFSRHEAKVAAIAGRNLASVERLAAKICSAGGEAIALQCDVSQEDQIKILINKVFATYGRIDILVNSAGIIGPAVPIDQMNAADWNRIFQVNVNGTFLCCKHCIPFMQKQAKGNVINLSSTAGLRASLISPCYSATKGAIIALTKSLALAYAQYGIRINCICPGTIETPMADSFFNQEKDDRRRKVLIEKFIARHPLGRFGTPEDVANGALYLASDVSSFITGINLVIDGGISL
jgi:NAD(P)-dependent dehydrogenase (short-subunit alcohol dehydrogenase family)